MAPLTRAAGLVLLALTCLGGTCGDPGPSPVWGTAPTDVCAAEPVVGLTVCPLGADFPWDQDLEGWFEQWQLGEVWFVTPGGDAWALELRGEEESLYGLPDLAEPELIGLQVGGYCDAEGGPSTVLYAWRGDAQPEEPGALLLLAGNVAGATAGPWTVEAGADPDACPDAAVACDCWEECRSKPVRFGGPFGAVDLFQREEALRDGVVLRVSEAWSGRGGACADASAEVQVWSLFRP
jgi:hypothetical protein